MNDWKKGEEVRRGKRKASMESSSRNLLKRPMGQQVRCPMGNLPGSVPSEPGSGTPVRRGEHVSPPPNKSLVTNRGRRGAAEVVDDEGSLDGNERSGAKGVLRLPGCNQASILCEYLLLG